VEKIDIRLLFNNKHVFNKYYEGAILMSKRIVNPFTPNRPINDPNNFYGRKFQIDNVVDVLFQTANKNPLHSIITGDRGIGKSSLLLQAKKMAEGDTSLIHKLNIDMGGMKEFNYVTVWHDTVENQTAGELAGSLLRSLKSDWTELLSKVEINLDLFGILQVGKKESEESAVISDIVSNFVKQIIKISKKVKESQKDGIILFIDEIDRMDLDSGLATFFKLVTERLERENVTNIIFFCAGIVGAVQKMKDEHPSIVRTFKDIVIHKLTPEESGVILNEGFKKIGYSCNESVLNSIYIASAGFPEPVHLIGSEIIHHTNDKNIEDSSYKSAIENIVKNKRKNELHDRLVKAGSGKYQVILKYMAKHPDIYVPLKYISAQSGMGQPEYSMNINQLCERNIIYKYARGVYAFKDPLLKEYILIFGVIEVDQEGTS